MDISWDNQKCPKNGGIIILRRFWPSADLNEIFSAEKWLKHKYPKVWTVGLFIKYTLVVLLCV
jgi:hypothetical protein